LTEIPEHLLKRSKSAKAAAGGGDPGDAADTPAESADPGAAPVAASATTPAVPTESLPNLDPEPEPAPPEPAYVTASKARRRIPVWALPVVAALPIWALAFGGTMQQPETEDPLLVEGELFYSEAGCSGCHGAAGGGGSGYALSDGEVLATFPSVIDHLAHVARGSAAIAGEAYGAERADGVRVSGSRGQMPAQLGQVPLVELEMIVFHERAILSGEDTSQPGYEEWMEHMREAYESGDESEIDLELLLQCADPAITPGAGPPPPAGDDGSSPCPGPGGFAAGEGESEAAAG
jgi:hypothetical protein